MGMTNLCAKCVLLKLRLKSRTFETFGTLCETRRQQQQIHSESLVSSKISTLREKSDKPSLVSGYFLCACSETAIKVERNACAQSSKTQSRHQSPRSPCPAERESVERSFNADRNSAGSMYEIATKRALESRIFIPLVQL